MRLLSLILLLTVSGCTTMDHNRLVSPSESQYYRANQHYENKEFSEAIIQYEAFLETKPRSSLAKSAKLNLGMSHYYNQDYKQTYFALKDVSIEDENIKKYVSEIVEESRIKAKDEIDAQEASDSASESDIAEGEEIEITILDAMLDNFGSVVLKGKVDTPATIIIDNKKISPDANYIFNATASWKKGESILISASNNGNTGELNYFPDREPPEEPLGLRAINIGSNSIEIEWDENTEDDIKGYRLFYKRQGDSLHEVPDLIKDTKHEVVGLAGGSSSTIEFYLRAVDKMDNESDDSEILEADLL